MKKLSFGVPKLDSAEGRAEAQSLFLRNASEVLIFLACLAHSKQGATSRQYLACFSRTPAFTHASGYALAKSVRSATHTVRVDPLLTFPLGALVQTSFSMVLAVQLALALPFSSLD